MLVLAAVQTTDALCTNESIHFNNRSSIWHRGPSSTLHPGRGSHSCFQTAVHYQPPGPRINSSDLIWPADKGKTLCLSLFSKGFRFGLPEELSPLARWRLRSPEICAWTILAVRGGIYLPPSFKPYTKEWEDSYWDFFWNTTGTLVQCSKLCESSVFLWRSGGAQRLAVDLLLFAKVLQRFPLIIPHWSFSFLKSALKRTRRGLNVRDPRAPDQRSERIKRAKSWRGDGSGPVLGA